MSRLLLIAAALAAVACDGTDTGNPYPQRLTVDAHSSEPDVFSIAIPQSGGVVTEVWLSLDHFGFVRDGDDACDMGIAGGDDTPDLGVADHAAAGGTSVDVTLAAGDYCNVSIPFVTAAAPLPPGAPAELDGASIVLSGTTGGGTDFLIASDLATNITLTGPAALRFDAELGPVFLGFDVAAWLDAVDIDGAGPGPVIIDAATNAARLGDFEANLAAGIELYRDLDDNGQADPGDELIASGQ